ncbi:DUF349 domain-containing protein [Palleniella muris]|uniref:DUF349 domain-containing protein n=1 Tax=Palleniella muris TaxID=3038145 RepID=A0AC61QTT0_9BACT|nr:DUF349 domain-containing protein [Palleniella muris]TGX83873.1 DUF349 domain-containing protein [Palleniella muris]
MMDSEEKRYETMAQVIERVKELAQSEETPEKEEVELLKSLFYKLHFQEREQKLKTYLDEGGDPEKYVIQADDSEEAFKSAMAVIREKRQKVFAEQEAEKQANLVKKQSIIEKIKTMVTSPEEANKSYQDFKDLQAQWKEIGQVPAENATEMWRSYQLYVEQFYDLLKLNSEAREYDFKKNLEAKTRLCELAEKLADEEDIISAFHQLQDLHQEYREVGPVAKDLREQVWTRFKAASTVINKRHQQHFEDIRAKEEENLTKKTALCEQAEELSKRECQNSAEWEEVTKLVLALQAEWKTIGFAPQKMNVKIFERFRVACDRFFQRKTQYFKEMKERFAANAEKKQALVDKAKELMDSTDWKQTAEKMMQLQKEWKEIGMVPKKVGDQLWQEFLGACNHFFEARNAANSGTRNAEKENLQKKKDIVVELERLAEEAGDDLQQRMRELIDKFNEVGHVPFKEKDKIYDDYHAALDKIHKVLNANSQRRRMDNFKQNIKAAAKRGEQAVDNERTRLQRRLEQMKGDLKTYENNLGFLSISSKKGNSLLDEMNRRVEKLKEEIELVKKQIKEID